MKAKNKPDLRQVQLKMVSYGNSYYIDRVAKLEKVLTKEPKILQIDMIGMGEIPADFALLIRSILMQRSPITRLITNARSGLQNGSVLVWLLGDTRIIREDAIVFFRPMDSSEVTHVDPDEAWKEEATEFMDSYSTADPDEGDHAHVLELINEFLPVQEMAGRLIRVPVLKQFGLVDHDRVDAFLNAAFGSSKRPCRHEPDPSKEPPDQRGSISFRRNMIRE